MKGDFTRVTFDPNKHYSRVLMQQGRVQLDADWNEQAAILLHYLQVSAADFIGPYGGPEDKLGFALSPLTDNANDFSIGAGHYYVDGLLCESDGNASYFKQRDYQDEYSSSSRRAKLPAGSYLTYLDVWEHHLTLLEDGQMSEVALGGPDTATRAKLVWQVRVSDMPDGKTKVPANPPGGNWKGWVDSKWNEWVAVWQDQSRCQLRVRLKPTEATTDPCTIPPTSSYRGQENQLYRVEIHAGGKLEGGPTFKWSRDNGSTVAAWKDNTDDDGLILSSVRGFANVRWIEITSAADDLNGKPQELLKVARLEGDALYVEHAPTWEQTVAKKVRRWDQSENETVTLKDGAITVTEGTTEPFWIDLENGIQVQFQPPAQTSKPNQYRAGDYWLIPARINGPIEWPPELDEQGQPRKDNGNVVPQALRPHGIEHHYAPLGLITVADDGKVTMPTNGDLRRKFSAIAS